MAATVFADEELLSFRAGGALNLASGLSLIADADVNTHATGGNVTAKIADDGLAGAMRAKSLASVYAENEVLRHRLARDVQIPFHLGEVTGALTTVAGILAVTKAAGSTKKAII